MIENYQYDKKGLLGKGSFGTVYKAKNLKNGEYVALKVLDMKMFHDQFMIDSLKNEIKVMQTLTSPNVVRMIECFGNKMQTYMVIELCDSDVRKLMQKKVFLQENEAVDVMGQLMNGFQDLVQHNYIHRDIKPENCLIKNNIYKVADFGFATKIDINGRQLLSDCVGTPIYMSPQILSREHYTAKSDIWSIGMMFYEMLFGKTPWSCRDMNSLLRNIHSCPLRFPYERPISTPVKNFLKRCLVVDEYQRMGWNEIFTHEMFKQKNQPEQQQRPLSQRVIGILKKLQDTVLQSGLDIHYIFTRFDKDKNNYLDIKEFRELILCVDPKIPQDDLQQLFVRISQKDGRVDYKEFQNLFTEFDFCDIKDRAGHILKDIQEVIKANNINLQSIFIHFDQNRQGDLDYNEFNNLIRSIVPGLNDHEIHLIFDRFDRDGNGSISYAEFQYIISKGTGQTIKNNLSSKAQGVLKQLQYTVKKNQLDILKIFTKFDTSGDNILDEREFLELMRAIDPTICKNEAASIFHIFDRNNDHMITYEEFKRLF